MNQNWTVCGYAGTDSVTNKTWDIFARKSFDDYHGSITQFQTSKLIYQSLYDY